LRDNQQDNSSEKFVLKRRKASQELEKKKEKGMSELALFAASTHCV